MESFNHSSKNGSDLQEFGLTCATAQRMFILITVMAVKMKMLLPSTAQSITLAHSGMNTPIYHNHGRMWETEAVKASREISPDLGLQSR